MARYPEILVNTTNPLLELFAYSNVVSNDIFCTGLMIVIFVILLGSMRKFGHRGALSSLFICTILSWFMRILGLVSELVSIFFTVGFIGMSLYYFLKGLN